MDRVKVLAGHLGVEDSEGGELTLTCYFMLNSLTVVLPDAFFIDFTICFIDL